LREPKGFASVTFDVTPILMATDDDIENHVSSLCEVLGLASVATDTAHHADCQKTADWMTRYFQNIGFKTK
jgi:hypothetical protein